LYAPLSLSFAKLIAIPLNLSSEKRTFLLHSFLRTVGIAQDSSSPSEEKNKLDRDV